MVLQRLVLACALAALVPSGRASIERTPAVTLDPVVAAPIDPVFAGAICAESPARHILRSIAVDLDRDGDLDVIAATVEEPVVIWIRDASGHYTRQRQTRASRMAEGQQVSASASGGGIPGEPAPAKWRTAAAMATSDAIVDLAAGRALAGGTASVSSFAPASDPTRGPPSRPLA